MSTLNERLHGELAKALQHDAPDPPLCDLVAIAGKHKRDLDEATRLLNSVSLHSRDHHVLHDIERFLTAARN